MYFESVSTYIQAYGPMAVFVLMFLNAIASTPPSELVLALGGATAVARHESLLATAIAAVTGNLAGAMVLYSLGRRIGYSWMKKARQRALSVGIPHLAVDIILPDYAVVDRLAETLRSRKTVWIGLFRCVPMLRSIVSLPAGMIGMSLLRFLGWSAAGIVVWCAIWISMGSYLQEKWHQFSVGVSAVLITAACVIVLVAVRHATRPYYPQVR
jgi:membrane protein DedA with SNARE-associated domain